MHVVVVLDEKVVYAVVHIDADRHFQVVGVEAGKRGLDFIRVLILLHKAKGTELMSRVLANPEHRVVSRWALFYWADPGGRESLNQKVGSL